MLYFLAYTHTSLSYCISPCGLPSFLYLFICCLKAEQVLFKSDFVSEHSGEEGCGYALVCVVLFVCLEANR